MFDQQLRRIKGEITKFLCAIGMHKYGPRQTKEYDDLPDGMHCHHPQVFRICQWCGKKSIVEREWISSDWSIIDPALDDAEYPFLEYYLGFYGDSPPSENKKESNG